MKDHPSPRAQGHGRELASGHCRPVYHARPALPAHLPKSEVMEDSVESKIDEDSYDEEDGWIPCQCGDSSSLESSDTDSLDSSDE